MPEPKGRGGKKPKYQIADIGGTDLTSEDISTERVLNFLIKGEIGSIGEGSQPASGDVGSAATPTPPATARPESTVLPERSIYSDPTEAQPKKSLSHLFERAGGSSGTTKDPLAQSAEVEAAPVPFSVEPAAGQPIVRESVRDLDPRDPPGLRDVSETSTLPSAPVASDVGADRDSRVATPIDAPTMAPSVEFPSGLAEQVERWKSLYRLNSGEIAALKTLFLLVCDAQSSECYIKMRKLAEMSSLDYRYCQKVVRSLERLGWITKLQDYDASTQMGVLYRVNSRPVHLT